jgi:hypothetical protein
MSNTRDVLLTGLPRSGTTLACELLNGVPDTVALDEPMDVELLTGHRRRPGVYWEPSDEPPDQTAICDRIARFLGEMRHSIETRNTAISHQVDGRVSGATRMSGDHGETGLRTALATRQEIRIDKPLSPAFLLVAKHPAAFAAIVETASKRFPVFAVVRNPIFVLRSWQTVPILVREGHHPVAERIEPSLGEALARLEDRLDRQLHLLAWFFEKFRAHLPKSRIISYESIVASGGKALSAITDEAGGLSEALESRDRAELHDRNLIRMLGERLLATDGPYWDFYTRESVELLLS